ncbi:MAG: flagellar hook-length control protein FliK [Woeseiaceae bacterium]
MLATLNLQLSPVELLDDTLTTPASPLPDAGGDVESGFANLLRLRVDASLAYDSTGGELLPPDGSGLPILTEPVAPGIAPTSLSIPSVVPELAGLTPEGTELSPEGAELTNELMAASDAVPPAERSSIVLDTPVLYPALNEAPSEGPEMPVLSLPLPASSFGGLEANPGKPVIQGSEALDTRDQKAPTLLTTPVAHPEVAARMQEVLSSAGERLNPPPAGIGLRQRGQFIDAQSRVPLMPQTAEINEKLPLVELPKRPETVSFQRTDSPGEALTDIIRPRAVVPQPVQVLQAQINAQPSQPVFTAAPVTAAAGEVSYAAVAQQATDLIGTPVRDSAWGEQVSERVVMMAGNQLKMAEIRLTPAELGPLRVRVSVEDGAANVTFHAQHAVTREAIEQALPRLREMLAENGLSLGQADVGEHGVAQGERDGGADDRVSNQATDEGPDVDTADEHDAQLRVTTSNGLVDTFA